jgi:hypothetical protein
MENPMIVNTEMRKSQEEERINLRCSQETFTNIITAGSNCSEFEAKQITKKAIEVFDLGEHSDSQRMFPGQMLWNAIDATEPPGKPLSKCIFKRIVLTLHEIAEDTIIKHRDGSRAKRIRQILRISNEAYDQGTCLTIEDLSIILGSDEKTIRTDIKRYLNREVKFEEIRNIVYLSKEKKIIYTDQYREPKFINILPPDYSGLLLSDYLAPEVTLPIRTASKCYWAKCKFCVVTGNHLVENCEILSS